MGENTKVYAAKRLTCSQCGAGFLSTGTQTAGKCIYCGCTGIFESRTEPVPAPKHLIPFSVTKEACISRHTELMKKRIFAPGALRSGNYLEQYRGLYLPYWDYHITQEGRSILKGKRVNAGQQEELELSAQLDADYHGIFFDASQAFDDRIAEQIAPFSYRAMAEFSPEYLSGNYAGVADVAASVYVRDAKDLANGIAAGSLPLLEGLERERRDTPVSFRVPESQEERDELFHTKLEGTSQALFPVWFLSWKRRDRMAYAVMNGQTGRMVMDLPVDPLRYVGLSMLFAVPVFLLLLLLPALSGRGMLGWAVLAGLLADVIYGMTLKETRARGYGRSWTEYPAGAVALLHLCGLLVFLLGLGEGTCVGWMVAVLVGACIVMVQCVEKYNLLETRPAPGKAKTTQQTANGQNGGEI